MSNYLTLIEITADKDKPPVRTETIIRKDYIVSLKPLSTLNEGFIKLRDGQGFRIGNFNAVKKELLS